MTDGSRIIVPAFRAMGFLPRCLRAIAEARGRDGAEVVLVDDGENAGIEALAARAGARVVPGPRRGDPGAARNAGAEGAPDAATLVFVDADVEISPDALAHLCAPVQDGRADATFGCYSANVDGMTFAQQYKNLYLSDVYSRKDGHVRNYFWTALAAIRAGTFRRAGGFRPPRDGTVNEDTELGRELTRLGCRVSAVPGARARHLKAYTVRSLVANDWRKGTSSVRLFLRRDGVKLTDNVHASRRDVVAVGLAAAVLGMTATAPLVLPLAPAAVVAGAAYLAARAPLLATMRRRGLVFAARSLPLMYLLDLVRAACVVRGGSLLLGRGAGGRDVAGAR